MNKFNEIIRIADIHAERVRAATDNIRHLFSIDAAKVRKMQREDLAWTELSLSRFSKLQDLIGRRIIAAFFEMNEENTMNVTILDKVRRLEKLELLDAQIWKDMRNARNHTTHEYPDAPELTAKYLNPIYDLAPKLIEILNNIKSKVSI